MAAHSSLCGEMFPPARQLLPGQNLNVVICLTNRPSPVGVTLIYYGLCESVPKWRRARLDGTQGREEAPACSSREEFVRRASARGKALVRGAETRAGTLTLASRRNAPKLGVFHNKGAKGGPRGKRTTSVSTFTGAAA